MGVVAPYITQEGVITPYVTVEEVLFSATAAAIDFTSLIPGGNQAQQTQALQDLITRASAKADRYTMGMLGTLNATLNTENGRYTANRMGQIIVNPYFTPITELRSFSIGYGPGQGLSPVTLTNDNVSIERDNFIVTYASSVGLTTGPLSIAGGNWSLGSQLFAEWTYVNGFANTILTSANEIGDVAIEVRSTIGIYPNMALTIWDAQYDETVVVSPTWDGTSTVIPIVGPTQYVHNTGVNVSVLPSDVKQAVIHFVIAMVKERGQGGLVLSEIGEGNSVTSKSQTSADDEAQAYDLLDPFRSIWGRA
jgi:hypothetical protein